MKTQAKGPKRPAPPDFVTRATPKVVQRATPQTARVALAALTAPGVVQARMAQFKTGPKIAAPPVYRPVAKKIVQPKFAGHAVQPKLRGSLLTTARTIQRAEEDPYKKQYKEKRGRPSSKRASAQASPYGEKSVRSERIRAKQGGGGIRPSSAPKTDGDGTRIWDGSRNSLKWSDAITAAMVPLAAGGCQIQDPGCTGGANQIDHIADFATRQSEIAQHSFCDGEHHWVISYLDDALAIYNNNDDATKFQWACGKCNGGKGGAQGLYENQPQWMGLCPGEECDLDDE